MLKKSVVVGMGMAVWLTWAMVGWGAEDKSIVLVDVGTVGKSRIEELSKEMEKGLVVPFRGVSIAAPETVNLPSILKTVGENLKPTDVCAIILVPGLDAAGVDLLVEPGKRWAIINAKALRENLPDENPGRCFDQRVFRQVVRGLAFVSALPYSPDPRSVHKPVEKVTDLDSMGSTLSPDLLSLFYYRAEELGLRVMPITIKP